MPAPVVTWEGRQGLMLAAMRGILSGANNARVRLFANNITPTGTTIWSDFLEANFNGYASVLVPAGIDQGLNFDQADIWSLNPAVFTMTVLPVQAVYGYWIDWTNPLTGLRQSLWCQRFAAPFLFSAAGVSLPIILTPGFTQG